MDHCFSGRTAKGGAGALGECSVWGATDRWPLPARKLVDDYAQFARTCQDSASGTVGACGPKSPDSHRVVWGLTSRPPVPPCGLSSGFPFARRVLPPSPACFWFPFVRRSPVCSLRPLPRFRFPFGVPPGSLPLSDLHVSAAAGRFHGPWSREAGTKVTSPAAATSPGSRDPPACRWAAAGHDGCRHRIACYERPRAQDIAEPEPPRSAAVCAVTAASGCNRACSLLRSGGGIAEARRAMPGGRGVRAQHDHGQPECGRVSGPGAGAPAA